MYRLVSAGTMEERIYRKQVSATLPQLPLGGLRLKGGNAAASAVRRQLAVAAAAALAHTHSGAHASHNRANQ